MESITKTVVLDDNETVVFSRLDLSDLFSLTDEVQAEREQVARQLGREEGLDKYEIMNLVLEVRTRKPTVSEILQSCSSPQGAYRILNKSLSKSKVEKDKTKSILSRMSIPDCLDVARMLVLDVQEEKPKTEGKVENPLPVSPSTGSESPKEATQCAGDGLGYYGKK